MATVATDMPPLSRWSFLHDEVAAGITIAKLLVMVAALVSLFVDQSFSGAFGAITNYATGTLDGTADESPWISIGYNGLYDTVIMATPWLIERFGRRSVFGTGHFVFAALTLYLASTTSLHAFMVGRCFQGLAQGTFFVCSVLTVLTLPPPKLRPYAFSIFSVTSLSGAASGAFIGGWFIDHAYWRGALVLYALLALFAGAIIAALLEAPGPAPANRFDWPGIACAFLAFFGLQYVLAFGERRDWIWGADIDLWGLAAIAGFVGFIWRELTQGRCGFIQLRLFYIRNLAIGSILGFGLGVPLFGANLFVQYAEVGLGFPPSTAGALLTLRIFAIAIVAPTAVLLVNADVIDVRVPVFIGFVLVSLSYAMLSLLTTSLSDVSTFVVAIVISGAGFACLFSPIANVLVRSLPENVRAEGIAIFKIVLLLGGSLASSLLGVVYDHSVAGYRTLLASQATLHHFAQVGSAPNALDLAALVQQASVLGFADNSKVVALVSLLNIPLLFYLRRPGATAQARPSQPTDGEPAAPIFTAVKA